MDPVALLSARAFSATPRTPAGSTASRIKSFKRMIHLLLRSVRGDRIPCASACCLFLRARCCRESTDPNLDYNESLVRVIRAARPKGLAAARFYLISGDREPRAHAAR